MYYGRIYDCDVQNGIGMRVSPFVSGCTQHRPECFNPETWDFHFGNPFTPEVQKAVLEAVNKDYIDGLTVLGGEPWEPENQRVLLPFFEDFRSTCTRKSLWTFSGYTWEELTDPNNTRCHTRDTLPMLALTDILIDGEFHIAEKDVSLRFRGSRNQRILDVPRSLEAGKPVLSPYMGKQS